RKSFLLHYLVPPLLYSFLFILGESRLSPAIPCLSVVFEEEQKEELFLISLNLLRRLPPCGGYVPPLSLNYYKLSKKKNKSSQK
ncbi:MAG: hypothetical protein IJ876_04605, partial [Elusimicrobiaceae bacterium]|nr:hypothetical protein [Elusimicrobiaceae bacterium]